MAAIRPGTASCFPNSTVYLLVHISTYTNHYSYSFFFLPCRGKKWKETAEGRRGFDPLVFSFLRYTNYMIKIWIHIYKYKLHHYVKHSFYLDRKRDKNVHSSLVFKPRNGFQTFEGHSSLDSVTFSKRKIFRNPWLKNVELDLLDLSTKPGNVNLSRKSDDDFTSFRFVAFVFRMRPRFLLSYFFFFNIYSRFFRGGGAHL